MDAVANGRNCVSLGAGNFCAAHAEKVPFIDAPLLGWGERSECFLQLLAALICLFFQYGAAHHLRDFIRDRNYRVFGVKLRVIFPQIDLFHRKSGAFGFQSDDAVQKHGYQENEQSKKQSFRKPVSVLIRPCRSVNSRVGVLGLCF